MIRLVDILLCLFILLVALPFFLVISIVLLLTPGGIFYTQVRVGKKNKDFKLYKFRTMVPDADSKGLLTIGGRDSRITKTGYLLRKYKLDELPQLLNILKGDMSFVGPRPEVRKYVDLYNEEQMNILSVRPGLSDLASLTYFNENELLSKADNPEEFYIQEVMPEKIRLNGYYIENPSFANYMKVIIKTVFKVFQKQA